MPVDTLHPEYTDNQAVWRKNRDAAEGLRAMRRNFGYYFPKYVPDQPERYKRACATSRYYNLTGPTVARLTGAAFSVDPSPLNIPAAVAYLAEDADGAGNDLEQVAKQTTANVTTVGRHGLLVDYPSTDGESLSRADVAALGLRASIQQYTAESIINWKTRNKELSLVALKEVETVENSSDPFAHDKEDRYRVYWLDSQGQCRTGVFEAGYTPGDDDGSAVTAAGSPLKEIPFKFVGSVDNTPSVDKAPIADLADTNIAHFVTSIYHVENLALHGQFTVGITSDMDQQTWVKLYGSEPLSFGANYGYYLGQTGGFSNISAPESSSLSADLKQLKEDMISQGAAITDPTAGNMTAKQAGIEAKERVSLMMNVVLNVSDAIEWAINLAERFETDSPSGDAQYRISTKFNEPTASAEDTPLVMALMNAGQLTDEDVADVKMAYLPYLRSSQDTTTADAAVTLAIEDPAQPVAAVPQTAL